MCTAGGDGGGGDCVQTLASEGVALGNKGLQPRAVGSFGGRLVAS